MTIKIFWGSLLRDIRLDKHLTQNEVAEILHMTRQGYSYIECGKLHPTAEQLAILSNVYDTDLYRYALKCMPLDYVAEQSEFRTYINSTNLASERKKIRKEKKDNPKRRQRNLSITDDKSSTNANKKKDDKQKDDTQEDDTQEGDTQSQEDNND
ncbi:MAG: helix-turn-helix transcriptional regulator [Eubacterium sp.]|nr:helix-turn-helix transcriptional regulator [Eubacterium sp.]